MVYTTEHTRKALMLCYAGLKNQLAEDGMPVLFDFFAAASDLDDEYARVTALLYGAISSGHFSIQNITEQGFPDAVLHALQILSQHDTLPHKEYIACIMTCPLAWATKLAVLRAKGATGNLHRNSETSDVLKEQLALESLFSVPYCMQPEAITIQERVIRNRKYYDQNYGCLIGGAVGDAFGYGITKENGEKCISSFTQEGLFCAVGSLVAWTHYRFDMKEEDYIFFALRNWAMQGDPSDHSISWISSIPELQEYRSPDTSCIALLTRGQCGSFEKPISSNKSASVLSRVAPLVIHHKNDLRKDNDNVKNIMKLAARVTAITHGHQLAWLSAALLAHLLSRSIYGGCRTGDHLNAFLREGKQYLFLLFGSNASLLELFEIIDLAVTLAGNKESDDANIARLGQGLFAHEALAIAIYSCLRYALSFYSAVTAASMYSGNAAASITGQLMGAKVGGNRIAQAWIDAIECHEVVRIIASDLTDECHLRQYGDYDDPIWRKKYISCDYTMK